MDPLTEIARQGPALVDGFRRPVNREGRGRRIAESLKEFERGGKYFYAPRAEKEKARKQVIADLDHEAGTALYALGRWRRDNEGLVADLVAQQRRPPTPEQAHYKRNNGRVTGMSLTDNLLLGVKDELVGARVTPMLRNAPPSTWMATYEAALTDPTEQTNATTIRLLESLLDASPTAFPGAMVDLSKSPEEASAILRLRTKVETVRNERVPPEVRQAQAAIELARKVELEAEDVHHVLPINPERHPAPTVTE